MDLLFKRYASPFSFVNQTIRCGRFEEFVVEFSNAIVKEKEEKQNWEFFLHKIWEGTYQDFVDGIKDNNKNLSMTRKTIETTVNQSLEMLNNFNPDE